jgi:hypothetical protein
MSCFDYVNGLADLVVGYMGAPFGWQWIVVRNETRQRNAGSGDGPARYPAGGCPLAIANSRGAAEHSRL